VLDAFRAFGLRTRWQPEANVICPQRVEAELLARKLGPGGPWDGRDADLAAQMAVLMLPVGGQHLAGMAALLRSCEVIFPLAPLVRSLLEVCGRITWLLDPRVANPRHRAARLMLARIDDATRAKSLAYALGQERDGSRLGQTLRDLRRRELGGRFYGSEVVPLANGGLIIAEQSLPGLRQSVAILDEVHDEAWNAGGLYDYLSAASHPTLRIAVEMLDRESVLAAAESAQDLASEARAINFRLPDMNYPRVLMRNATLTFLQTWALTASYHGVTTPELDELGNRIDRLTSSTDAQP